MDTIFWIIKILFGLFAISVIFFLVTEALPALLGVGAVLGFAALVLWAGWSIGGFIGAVMIIGTIGVTIAIAAVAFDNLAH